MNNPTKLIGPALLVMVLAGTAGAIQTQRPLTKPLPDLRQVFSLVHITSGQTAQVSVVNTDNPALAGDSNEDPCRVTLRFSDQTGQSLKESDANIFPRQAASLLINREEIKSPEQRVGLWAEVLIGNREQQPPCHIVATLQLLNSDTGETEILYDNPTDFQPYPSLESTAKASR